MEYIEKIIEEIVEECRRDFEVNPYDYSYNEIGAQVKLYNALEKRIQGNILLDRNNPVPEFKSLKASRVKLEWCNNKYSFRHDIVILKDNAAIPTGSCPPEKFYGDICAFIEVKAAWGEYRHLTYPSYQKDFELVSKDKDKGYFIIFIANRFDEMTEKFKLHYENDFKKFQKDYDIKAGHLFLLFRDKILY